MEAHGASHATIDDATTFILGETALDIHCWGLNPVVVTKLQLKSQDRYFEHDHRSYQS